MKPARGFRSRGPFGGAGQPHGLRSDPAASRASHPSTQNRFGTQHNQAIAGYAISNGKPSAIAPGNQSLSVSAAKVRAKLRIIENRTHLRRHQQARLEEAASSA